MTRTGGTARPAGLFWRDSLQHPLFAGVRDNRVEPILREMRPRRVRAGMLLFAPGATPAYLHLVLSGRLHAYLLNSSGHQLVLEIIEAGGMDGVIGVSGMPGHFSEVADDAVVLSVSAPQLERLVAVEPRIAMALVAMTAARLQAREEQMEAMASRGASGLAHLLLMLARAQGSGAGPRCGLQLRLTHQMLADMLGVRRETVTVQCLRLIRSGAVEMIDGRMSLDRVALVRLAERGVGVRAGGPTRRSWLRVPDDVAG